MAKVVVIGAGISGLGTAYHLEALQPGIELTVLEAGARPGGTVWTERRAGFQVEVGANGFLDNKPSTLNLGAQVGLQAHLIPALAAARRRFLFQDGRLQPLPERLWEFWRTPLLSWRGKLRLLAERFQPRRDGDAEESVHAFACRRGGPEAGLFADALVTGIHAGDPRLLSMEAAFPRIVAMERRSGSVRAGMAHAAAARRAQAQALGKAYEPGSRLWTLRAGLRLLIESLRDRLRNPPLLGVRARRLERASGRLPPWIVFGEGRERWPADAVVLACPAPQQAEMVADLDAGLAEEIAAIPYSPAVVVALGYRRNDVPGRLDGFGYVAPQQGRRDILGVQWCSSIFPDRAPADMVLLRAIGGGWHRREVVDWDDATLLQAVRRELSAAMRIGVAPVFHHIVRWERAIPQYHLGHLERVARVQAGAARHQGLFLTGNAYHGVALNDCTEQAEIIARRVARFLAEDLPPESRTIGG